MKKHPIFCLRTSSILKISQEEATEEEIHMFLWETTKHVIGRKITPEHVLNMDENGFAQKNNLKKVIAIHVYQNVWSKTADYFFHLTMVSACNSKGFVTTILFIVPGMQLNHDVMYAC